MNKYKFQLYSSIPNSVLYKRQVTLDELVDQMEFEESANHVSGFRSGEARMKMRTPAFTPMGHNLPGMTQRLSAQFEDNGLVMVDLDHVFHSYEEACEYKAEFGQRAEAFREQGIILAYITISGTGLRLIFHEIPGLPRLLSAVYVCRKLKLPICQIDRSCIDTTRLSVITIKSDVLYWDSTLTETDDEGKFCSLPSYDAEDVKRFARQIGSDPVKAIEAAPKEGLWQVDEVDAFFVERQKETVKVNMVEGTPAPMDTQHEITLQEIQQNDALYAKTSYKGYSLRKIAEEYTRKSYPNLVVPEGERHHFYMELTKNFRNLCGNMPGVLHAILPNLGKPDTETMAQCIWACEKRHGENLPKTFYFWMKENGYLEEMPDMESFKFDETSQEDAFYRDFVIAKCPTLPPIMREYWRIAPYYFKLPVLAALQPVLGMLDTTVRSNYLDGAPMSTTVYNLIYAGQSCGKSFIRRLEPLLADARYRDKLGWDARRDFNLKSRVKGANENLGRMPQPKQRIFMARASVGDICERQEFIGPYHWLQIVPEFDTWAQNAKNKSRGDLSDMYRVAWDNEFYGQQFMSTNAYSGNVRIYPQLLATCTEGQIDKFFTNLEDGLVTRFSYIPILNQEFADVQQWKEFTAHEWLRIKKTVDRLNALTYGDGTLMDINGIIRDGSETETEYDFSFNTLRQLDMEFLRDDMQQWLTAKLKEAEKDANEQLSTLRKRSCVKAFKFAMLCYDLWGKKDSRTKKMVSRVFNYWAEVELHYMRSKWEIPMREAQNMAMRNVATQKKASSPVYDQLGETFTMNDVVAIYIKRGIDYTKAGSLVRQWKHRGWVTYNEKTNEFVKSGK